jgi:DNA-directed RNA polymerase specialized sigma subunit
LSVVIKYIGKNIENVTKKNIEDGLDSPYLSLDQVRLFKPIFDFLNEKDRDILYLIFVSRKKQKDVQRILRRSQPSLCYDIKRIRRRLRFIVYLRSVFDIFLNFVKDWSAHFTDNEMAILVLMFYTSSFTMTANLMGVSQVKVRYAYNKCLKRMEDMELWEPYEIFMVIRSNLNIIRRICRKRSKEFSLPLPL